MDLSAELKRAEVSTPLIARPYTLGLLLFLRAAVREIEALKQRVDQLERGEK